VALAISVAYLQALQIYEQLYIDEHHTNHHKKAKQCWNRIGKRAPAKFRNLYENENVLSFRIQ